MEKCTDRFYVDLQQIILNDIGRGSIFENIIKLNNEMSERLKLEVDMRVRAMRKLQDLGKHLVQKAQIDLEL